MSEKPNPLETHRFRVNPLSSELLHREIEAFEKLNKKHPGIKGIAFFGSRIKGKERPYSDVDMVMFYDSSELQDPTKTYIPTLGEAEESFTEAAGGNPLEFSAVDISKEATDQDLERFEKTSDARARFNLVTRFFLGVGEGLYENRRYLLDRLELQGEIGQLTFERLMQELSNLDRRTMAEPVMEGEGLRELGDLAPVKSDTPYKGKYPQTIADARRHFITDRTLWKPVPKPPKP